MVEEKIVFMQTEDNMVTFERENGDTIIYPLVLVPSCYEEGTIIKSIIHENHFIEFLELDYDEMLSRREKIRTKKLGLRARARRSTNKA